jgi:hypothetical protein
MLYLQLNMLYARVFYMLNMQIIVTILDMALESKHVNHIYFM